MAGEEEDALGTEGLSAGRGAALARLRPPLTPPSPLPSLEGLSISLPILHGFLWDKPVTQVLQVNAS